jgi:hypothetical protein
MADMKQPVERGAKGRNGDEATCHICHPRTDRIPHDHVWRWSLNHPGQQALREDVKA